MTVGHDTIFALSSGSPPAAIAVIRLSGPEAVTTLATLAGQLPPERRLSLRTLRDTGGDALDRAMVHWANGPATATGEDIAELHVHGGRAVVGAVLNRLGGLPGLRHAEPGEFTRRAFQSGRIDLSEAEGLADLLAAQTEGQRRAALDLAGGAFSRMVERWRVELLRLAAIVEAHIEYGEEEELGIDTLPRSDMGQLAETMRASLATPPAERLRDGVRVVIAGPPNAGKSTLLNALAGREAAIVSPIPGTTRDVIEAPVIMAGIPFVLADTAGLRDSSDSVEAEGVMRARKLTEAADILLWLGAEEERPLHRCALTVAAKADLNQATGPGIRISALTGFGLSGLVTALVDHATTLLPRQDQIVVNLRQRNAIQAAASAIEHAYDEADELLIAEHLRAALAAFDAAVGRSATEEMLDALFGGFCIGK